MGLTVFLNIYLKFFQYQACVMRCLEFDWPCEAISKEEMNGGGDDASSDSQPEADKQHNHFYEGSFLALLFDKLEDIVNQVGAYYLYFAIFFFFNYLKRLT